MLKFADLKVDNMSKRNSIESFMHYFPNSYLPLFMMHLGRHDLMDIVENYEGAGKQVILQISHEEISDFFKDSDFERPLAEIQAEQNALLKGVLDEKVYELVKSSISEIPLYELLKYRDKAGIDNIAMCLKEESCQNLLGIYEILSVPDEQVQKTNRVLLFLLLWEIGWDSFTNYLYSEKEDELATEKWIAVFDKSISKIQAYSREKIWMQPEELTQVILGKKLPGSMFNPFAGLASYSVKNLFDDDDFYTKDYALSDKYTGQEIDPVSWAVGKLRLLAYGTDSSNYVVSDSRNWTDDSFPNIISTPPFGVKIMNELGNMEYADHFVVRRSVNTMTIGGMAACVVPASFLTRKDTYELRKKLANDRLINTVVALPEGLFLPYTNVKTAIIFLKNEQNATVKFVDASRYYSVEGREKKLLKDRVKKLIKYNDFPDYLYNVDELKLQVLKSEFLSSISLCRTDEILEKDYTLNVHSYIRQNRNSNEGYETVFLSSIFFPILLEREEIFQKIRPKKHLEAGRFVSLDDLSSNPLLPYFDYTSLQRVRFDDSLEAIQGPAMLFSLKGEFRVSLLKDDQVVFVRKEDIASFYYDPKENFGEYIVNELSKQYVREDISDMELAETRTANDIELISILSPVFDKYDWNRNRVSAQKEALILEKDRRLLNLEQQLAELKDTRHDEYIKSLRQRKHRIQQVMNELCPAFSLLDKRRKESGVLHNEDIVGKRTGKTVSDYFSLIGGAIDKVETMITHFVDEDEWGESEFLKLKEFLKATSERNLSDRYSVIVNYHVNDGFGEDSIMVSLNSDKFATVFENIFSNALKWGFTDSTRNDYCIRIDVDKPNLNQVRIRVANNGEPIHPSLNRERLFEWGIGNHTGYGTWQVKNIVEHYLGTVALREYPDDEAGFQTEYEIVLPAYL